MYIEQVTMIDNIKKKEDYKHESKNKYFVIVEPVICARLQILFFKDIYITSISKYEIK